MSSNKQLGYFFLSVILLFSVSACWDSEDDFVVDYSIAEDYILDTTGVVPDTTESGLIIYRVEEGIGDLEVTSRDVVYMHYIVRSLETDEIFESSYVNGSTAPYSFGTSVAELGDRFGLGVVEGMIGMKEDEKRALFLVPDESISFFVDTIMFDVEIDEIVF